MSRLLNLQSGVWEKDGLNKINSYVNEWIAKDHPGDFNQAMMDLGATVCKNKILVVIFVLLKFIAKLMQVIP